MNFDNTYVKIDLDVIEANFTAIREKAGVDVMAVVKADAYGHGAVQVTRLLQDKCAFFGVSSILEAIDFIGEKFGVTLEKPEKIVCGWFPQNNQCIAERCPFHPVNHQ